MTSEPHAAMHADHRRWLSDLGMWQDDLALWRQELSAVAADLARAGAALEDHREAVEGHGRQLREELDRLTEHEGPSPGTTAASRSQGSSNWSRRTPPGRSGTPGSGTPTSCSRGTTTRSWRGSPCCSRPSPSRCEEAAAVDLCSRAKPPR